MSTASRLRLFYLSHLSKPASDRPLYSALNSSGAVRILELGLGDTTRAQRLIEVALWSHAAGEVHYTGIDLFEGRPDAAGISLKGTYQLLRGLGIRTQLLPGEPLSTLARYANNLHEQQLVIISHQAQPELLEQTWYYLPRVIAPECEVYLEERDGNALKLRKISRLELQKLAVRKRVRKAA